MLTADENILEFQHLIPKEMQISVKDNASILSNNLQCPKTLMRQQTSHVNANVTVFFLKLSA